MNGDNFEFAGLAALSEAERQRYARQMIVPGIGLEGQVKLKQAAVLVVGAGGLGNPAALYLAAAGIGRLGIADPDVVEVSNLQRQILHFSSDVGRPKVASAQEKLADINPFVKIETFPESIEHANVLRIINNYDVVIDGSDNFPARYVVNDACVLFKIPMVYGSVQHFFGQVSVFDARKGPCYRCLMASPPPEGSVPRCGESGVVGVIPGIIGTLQAAEAVKIILGLGTLLVGRMLFYNALGPSFDLIEVSKDPACPACGRPRSIAEPGDYEEPCESDFPGSRRETEFENSAPVRALSVLDLKRRIDAGEKPIFLDIQESGDDLFGEDVIRIPMSEIMSRTSEIPRDREVIVLCRVGIQSRAIIHELRDRGFSNLLNLEGGTIAWKYGIDIAP